MPETGEEVEILDLSEHHDRIIGDLHRWKDHEKTRATGAAETRQEIGQLIEDTGVNKKALAFIRALDKLKPEKREDVLMSFDALRDELEAHWGGQKTPDMFQHEGAVRPSAPEESAGDDDPIGEDEVEQLSQEADEFLGQMPDEAA